MPASASRAMDPPWNAHSHSRNLRDRRAIARYAGLTGAPDESGFMKTLKVEVILEL